MSSRTPFRSHLLQQWTQQGHRPPVAAVPWLRPASTNGDQNHLRSHSQIQDDDTGAASGEGTARSTSGGRNQRSCSTISSVASSFTLSTYNALQNSRRIDQSFSPTRRVSGSSYISSAAVSSTEKAPVSNSDEFPDETDNAFHSLLLSRRTASKPLTFSTTDDAPELRQLEIDHIRNAVDRAVQAAQMAPNHKRTEPFTFVRFWSGSQSAERLADICYQVTLRQKSEPVARKKREKWAQIPAFLVALVHDNQHTVDAHECDDPYDQLTFVPPMTNRQLEDYASASAAIQNVLLSLHANSIATKWATGPIISTVAFRQLVKADATDRVVGLIMIGGRNSAVLVDKGEEQMTQARRHRRRELYGDVLIDLQK